MFLIQLLVVPTKNMFFLQKHGEQHNTASQMVQYIDKNVRNKDTWRPVCGKGLRIETLLISIKF